MLGRQSQQQVGSAAGGLYSPGSVVGLTGLVAPQYLGSSWIREETVTPAWAGGFFTTEPPGKPEFH